MPLESHKKDASGTNMGSMGQDTWNEYSRLVLNKLDMLEENVSSLREDMRGYRKELSDYNARQDVCMAEHRITDEKVSELRAWKKDVDAVATPSQLKTTLQESKDTRDFMIKVTSTFAALQVIITLFIAWFVKK